jgi:hypothetical protein
LINFELFDLSDLEKHKLNQRTKAKLIKVFNWIKLKKKNQIVPNLLIKFKTNEFNQSVCTPYLHVPYFPHP